MTGGHVLVAFRTSEGHTTEIANRIAGRMREQGAEVDVRDAADAPAPAEYDGVVLGDSIHIGHHSKQLRDYAKAHADVLGKMPSALFQVSMTSAVHDEKHDQQAQTYVREFIEASGWNPDIVGMFAGALAYTQYGWLNRRIMVSIAKREGQPTDTSRDYDYTDWDAVDLFADHVLAVISYTDGEAGSPS
jgi:menaquinone-dependent protoporphyrinogen oxidase